MKLLRVPFSQYGRHEALAGHIERGGHRPPLFGDCDFAHATVDGAHPTRHETHLR